MAQCAHRAGAERSGAVRTADCGRQPGDAAALGAAAQSRRGGAANAGERRSANLVGAGRRMHDEFRERHSCADSTYLELRRSRGEGRRVARAGSQPRAAQGPAILQDHRHVAPRCGQSSRGRGQALVRHRCQRSRHAARRIREIAGVRRHRDQRQCRCDQGAARHTRCFRDSRRSGLRRPRRRRGRRPRPTGS